MELSIPDGVPWIISSTVNAHWLIRSRSLFVQSQNDKQCCDKLLSVILALKHSGICWILAGLMQEFSLPVADSIAPANATANAAEEPSPAPIGSWDVITNCSPPHVLRGNKWTSQHNYIHANVTCSPQLSLSIRDCNIKFFFNSCYLVTTIIWLFIMASSWWSHIRAINVCACLENKNLILVVWCSCSVVVITWV